MAAKNTAPMSPSERLFEDFAQALASLADDVLDIAREIRAQEQQHVDEPRP